MPGHTHAASLAYPILKGMGGEKLPKLYRDPSWGSAHLDANNKKIPFMPL